MTAVIHSFAIFVSDVERARIFYEDVLGFPVTKAGSFGFELFEEAPHIGVHPAQHPAAKEMVGRDTGITFRVPELLAFCSRIGTAGARFVAEPTQQSFGIMAMVADPDGNVMALWEDNVTEAKQAE